MSAAVIAISVAVAEPELQTRLELTVPAGTSVAAALALSGVAARHPMIDFAIAPVGIFGVRVTRDYVLSEGDRIEVYRSLLCDPKASRRDAARRGRTLGRRRN
jgi:hypothetical protein